MSHSKEACFQEALEAYEKAKGKLGVDYKLPWRQNLDGSWTPEDRGFWAGVGSMLKWLSGRGHENSVVQIRNPDLTINRRLVVDLKFTRADGTVDDWGTRPGRGNGRTQLEDYNDINRQTDSNAQDLKLDPETCGCSARGAQQEWVPDPSLSTVPEGQFFFMPLPSPGIPLPALPAPMPLPVPVPSSQDYKREIEPVNLNAERLLDLKPRTFRWKDTGQRDVGYIAEEVKEVLPELYYDDGSMKGYDLAKLPFYIIELIKQQQRQISDLKAELTQLREMSRGNNPSTE